MKKLHEIDVDWNAHLTKEEFQQIFAQLDPEDPITKCLVAGLDICFNQDFDRAMEVVKELK